MGDIQASDTIKVAPGDNLTFDWYTAALYLLDSANPTNTGTTTGATTQTTSSHPAITVRNLTHQALLAFSINVPQAHHSSTSPPTPRPKTPSSNSGTLANTNPTPSPKQANGQLHPTSAQTSAT
jgi:hypothetical protein